MVYFSGLKKLILSKADKDYSPVVSRFFKCGKGQYGEGDMFLGIRVPECRKIAKQFFGLSLPELEKYLKDKWHEIRLIALLILVEKIKKASGLEKKKIVSIYLKNTRFINNWDLVDLSAYHILGSYLEKSQRKILYKLVKSKSLWERRIAIVATFWFIRKGDFGDTLKIAEILSSDKEDLIHKACGWMLREVGKRDIEVLKKFLNKNYRLLPRTTLRHAIEKFSTTERKKYLEL